MEVYELRWYEVAAGRMDDLHARMRDIVPPIFARNGIPAPRAIWEAISGPRLPAYLYLLRWPDMRARELAFDRQYADRDRPPTRDAHGREITTRIHLSFLRPADCWQAFAERGIVATGATVGGLHELTIQRVANRRLGEAEAALRETDLPVLAGNGARILGVFEGWVGLPRPSLVHILAWPDLATRAAAYAAHGTHPAIAAARAREAETGGRPLFAGADVFLLQPQDYGPPQPSLGHFDPA